MPELRQHITAFVTPEINKAINSVIEEKHSRNEQCSRSHAIELALQESPLIQKHLKKTRIP